jgi:hypothetical protein
MILLRRSVIVLNKVYKLMQSVVLVCVTSQTDQLLYKFVFVSSCVVGNTNCYVYVVH